MADELFTIRDAHPDDEGVLNSYCYAEGMDNLPSIENVRVAVNDIDEVVGFIRIAQDAEGIAFVNPVITHETWRSFGVGRALMDEALAHYGELRLVSRGQSLAFYEAIGYERIPWSAIKMDLVEDCDHCDMRDECAPVPMAKRTK